MRMSMSLNLALLLAMVATNLLSFYHLSTTITTQSHHIPDHLIHRLTTIKSTIAHLARHRPRAAPSSIPPDLLLYSRLSPIATSCHASPDLLHSYMSYTPFQLCPPNSTRLAESLIVRGCHPLPRRRCFSPTPTTLPSSLPHLPFPSSLPDSLVIWSNYPPCKSFSCSSLQDPSLGFHMRTEMARFMNENTNLDLPIPYLIRIAKQSNSPLRIGMDIGGNTGTFAGKMKMYNVTVVTTTMNFNFPNSEAVAARGLVPMHVPLQQRLPVFDGVLDFVRCGRAINRWIPVAVLEFLLYDVDRALRGGGFLWLDRFFSKREDMVTVYMPLIEKLQYKKIKWAVNNKTVAGNKFPTDVYLTALLQKPVKK